MEKEYNTAYLGAFSADFGPFKNEGKDESDSANLQLIEAGVTKYFTGIVIVIVEDIVVVNALANWIQLAECLLSTREAEMVLLDNGV